MRRRLRAIWLMAITAALLSGVGCATENLPVWDDRAAATPSESVGQHRPPLSLDSRILRDRAHYVGLDNTDGPQWYDARNDRRPVVFAGYETATLEAITTWIRDRQSFHNGRPHDHYHNRTYRSSITETIR